METIPLSLAFLRVQQLLSLTMLVSDVMRVTKLVSHVLHGIIVSAAMKVSVRCMQIGVTNSVKSVT